MTSSFIENAGQWPEDVLFGVWTRGGLACLEADGIRMRLRGGSGEHDGFEVTRLRFEAARSELRPVGDGLQPARHNFFLNSEASRWRTDVRGFDSVLYGDLYPGIDLRVRLHGASLEYDVLLSPGADLDRVRFRMEGAVHLEIEDDGTLVAHTELGTIRQRPPATWQVSADGERREVECRYRLRGRDAFGFTITGRDDACRTVIDPGLDWSTYLGGTGDDRVRNVVVDAQGLVTVGGYTDSMDFPTTTGAYDPTHGGGLDVFLARFDPALAGANQNVWCTYLGGLFTDTIGSLCVSDSGIVTATGSTNSLNFPRTADAYQAPYGGGGTDRWIARLDPSASGTAQLLYSTFFGGDGSDRADALHVDPSGVVTLSGTTTSTDLPVTTGAYDPSYDGNDDVFVVRLDPSLTPDKQLLYCSYLGGAGSDRCRALAVEGDGTVTVGGWTDSTTFPTTSGAFSSTHNGGTDDGFLARLRMDGNGAADLAYATYLGGVGEEGVNGLVVDGTGLVTMTGATSSTGFPTTTGAYSPTYNGGAYDAFVTQMSLDGQGASDLRYSTFLGGAASFDYGYQLVLDTTGGVTVVGYTGSWDFPTTPCAYQPTLSSFDTFVSRLSLDGQGNLDLVSSTFLGGSSYEVPWGIAVDSANQPVVVGRTNSIDFPVTSGAFQPMKSALEDGFVTRLTMVAWSNYGAGWPGTTGIPSLTSSGYPALGRAIRVNAENSSGAPAFGILFLGLAPMNVATKKGGTLLVNPFLLKTLQVPAQGLSLGWTVPMDVSLCDLRIYLQLLQSDPGASGKISFTPGLELVLGG